MADSDASPRRAHALRPQDHAEFPNNKISTTRFRRVANIYFLVISILMLIGTYYPELFNSPLSPYSTLGPLIIVLGISISKEGFEDFKRFKSDREVNSRSTSVLTGDSSQPTQVSWENVAVGNVILVENKGEIPADMLVLRTSSEDGQCYIETSNIDGETNLKIKQAYHETAEAYRAFEEFHSWRGVVEYEHPNENIHNFDGRIRMTDDGQSDWVALSAKNMLLRGCTLRNTQWIVGLVIFTGSETKVMKKSGGARSKMSRLEQTINSSLRVVFAIQALLCTGSTIALESFEAINDGDLPYLRQDDDELVIPSWLGAWFTFLILYNNFIPISLYVTVEMVNYIQAFFIEADRNMYDPVTDTPAKARTSNLNQDLGQIAYVFSDKTGTLTENVMEFKLCCVGTVVFGVDENGKAIEPSEVGNADGRDSAMSRRERVARAGRDNGSRASDASPARPSTGSIDGQKKAKKKGPTPMPSTKEMSAILADPSSAPEDLDMERLQLFVTVLGVCHTVVPEKQDDGSISYEAESPDDAALTLAAKFIGLEFMERSNTEIVVVDRHNDNERVTYEVLGVHEFTSDRKRMSIIVRDSKGQALLLCKGADNVMLENAAQFDWKDDLNHSLSLFSSEGLRTLVLSYREMTDDEVETWQQEYQEANTALQGRRDKLEEVAKKYEREMIVLGATAIEDKLQDGVPETIADLARAGIKTWVLTGDKVETAINIGYSCRLLRQDMKLIEVVDEEEAPVRKQLKRLYDVFSLRDYKPPGFWKRCCRRLNPKRKKKLSGGTSAGDGSGGHGGAGAVVRSYPNTINQPVSVITEADSPPTTDNTVPSSSRRGSQGSGERLAPNYGSIHVQLGRNSERDTDSGGGGSNADREGGSDEEGDPNNWVAELGLVVTGKALTHILDNEEAKRHFLSIAERCGAVIACRVSPQQKAKIVQLVRKSSTPAPMTLAIGDGANDVGMIQQAEVGIGISGKEGLQAVNSSDFAIAQFRFLKPLLLVHGRWSYKRTAKVFLYSFFKNVVITLTLFFYTAMAGWSGTSFYESLVYSGFNFFLGLPIIAVGVIDRDVPAKVALKHPGLYEAGRCHQDLTTGIMSKWIIVAVLHSFVIFFIPWGVYRFSEGIYGGDSGIGQGLGVAGIMTYTCLIAAMNVKVAVTHTSWSIVNYVLLGLSVAGYFVFIIGYNFIQTLSPEFYNVAWTAMGSANFWFSTLLVIGAIFLIEFTLEHMRSELSPKSCDIAREITFLKIPTETWGDEPQEPPTSPPAQPSQATRQPSPAGQPGKGPPGTQHPASPPRLGSGVPSRSVNTETHRHAASQPVLGNEVRSPQGSEREPDHSRRASTGSTSRRGSAGRRERRDSTGRRVLDTEALQSMLGRLSAEEAQAVRVSDLRERPADFNYSAAAEDR